MKKPIYIHGLFWVITTLIIIVGLNTIVITTKTKSVATTNTNNMPKDVEKFVDIYNTNVKEKDAAIYMIPRDFKIEKANYKDGPKNIITLVDTLNDDLKSKTKDVDSFNQDAESLTIVLNNSKTAIQKVTYRGNRTNPFLFTLSALRLDNEVGTAEMFTKLNDKTGQKKFDITSFIKDYKVKFEYDLSAMPVLPTITFTFEKH
ncbi:hypothetical protein [Bacillus toyonensis]|uniref:hypothetical protein n=1 Tax=Bacillus toyonensis TaxID=155322 RepID=UPI000BF05711|nr:hypothetical protein [Bacillus toyonensis]PEO46526.1 hypothetical protein CN579_30965 [Bacillus toyonensis]